MRGDRHWRTGGGKAHNRPTLQRRVGLTARQRLTRLHAIGNRGPLVVTTTRADVVWRVAMQRFWMVYREGGGAPTAKHFTDGDARAEAERLARLHGGSFHVLAVVGTCKKVDVDWNWYGAEMQEPPF